MLAWQLDNAVPVGVAEALRVAQALLIHSYYVYDFALVAATWSMLALEASLKDCVGALSEPKLVEVIDLATERGLITKEGAEVLHATRRLRNEIVHGALLPSFPPSAAIQLVEGIHDAISDIYARAQVGPQEEPRS